MATDGTRDILSLTVEKLAQRCPIYIGSRFEVEKAKEYLAKNRRLSYAI